MKYCVLHNAVVHHLLTSALAASLVGSPNFILQHDFLWYKICPLLVWVISAGSSQNLVHLQLLDGRAAWKAGKSLILCSTSLQQLKRSHPESKTQTAAYLLLGRKLTLFQPKPGHQIMLLVYIYILTISSDEIHCFVIYETEKAVVLSNVWYLLLLKIIHLVKTCPLFWYICLALCCMVTVKVFVTLLHSFISTGSWKFSSFTAILQTSGWPLRSTWLVNFGNTITTMEMRLHLEACLKSWCWPSLTGPMCILVGSSLSWICKVTASMGLLALNQVESNSLKREFNTEKQAKFSSFLQTRKAHVAPGYLLWGPLNWASTEILWINVDVVGQ